MKSKNPEQKPIQSLTEKELFMKLDRARWWLLTQKEDLIFYSQLVMGLDDAIGDSIVDGNGETQKVEKAKTDCKKIVWNPEYLASLTDEQVRGALIEMALHPALGHPWRLPVNGKSNKAGDIEINMILNKVKEKGVFIDLPPNHVPFDGYDNKVYEEIYHLLEDEPSQNKNPGSDSGDSGDEDGPGDFTDPEGQKNDDDEDGKGEGKGGNKSDGDGSGKQDSTRDQWERRVIQAGMAAKATSQGDLPADLQRMLNDRLALKIDWRQETANFIKNCLSTKNDYTRAARRHAWQSVIYPRKKRDNVSLVVFIRDTSGSVSDEICAFFNSHIEQCLDEMGCQGIVLDCDAAVHAEYVVGNGMPVPKRAKGGGGTDFRPAFERIKEIIERGEQLAGIVYLTDLYGDFPQPSEVPDSLNVLWLSVTKDLQAPFGRTVYVEM